MKEDYTNNQSSKSENPEKSSSKAILPWIGLAIGLFYLVAGVLGISQDTTSFGDLVVYYTTIIWGLLGIIYWWVVFTGKKKVSF